jgi:hypothetical protein
MNRSIVIASVLAIFCGHAGGGLVGASLHHASSFSSGSNPHALRESIERKLEVENSRLVKENNRLESYLKAKVGGNGIVFAETEEYVTKNSSAVFLCEKTMKAGLKVCQQELSSCILNTTKSTISELTARAIRRNAEFPKNATELEQENLLKEAFLSPLKRKEKLAASTARPFMALQPGKDIKGLGNLPKKQAAANLLRNKGINKT